MDRVLIVEDDRIHLKRLTTFLEKYRDKFEIIGAADGQEAIDLLKEQPFSVMVTDIQMPRVDGLTLLAYVSENYPDLSCFVMTAYGSPQMKAMMPKDLLRFFNKPFEIKDLAQSIIDVLEKNIRREAFCGISILSFLQIIEMERASCLFEIRSPGKLPGSMSFEKGVLFDAECGELKGEAAALELIPREIATFRFKFFPQKIDRQIRTDLKALIDRVMEAGAGT